MGKNPIQVYGRLKPISSRERLGVEDYRVLSEDGSQDVLTLTHKPWGELINNKPESHTFRFKRVFDQDIKQQTVFETVAKPVANSVLEGYNGTIFAYGQTGSGKTYSITGGTAGHEQRGIIPRTVEYAFERITQSTECTYKVFVSYLEIYNESGFDLLNPDHQITKLEDLERVTLLEDERGFTHLRNLVLHEATTERQVLDLLFQGDVNRVIAETPMNPNSSRSHCIFTIHLEIRKATSAVVRHSKLNLVDLAGSERVYKSGIDGKILMQAKHINLSLHYLEQVIVALSDHDRTHIPYRNCMMTTVLKDTLGGNCLTTMIATMSLDKNAIEETVSTCRFAQRVALINNEAVVNEELDPNREIAILRKEVARLKKQLETCNTVKVKESLSADEVADCRRLVEEFSRDNDDDEEDGDDVMVAELPEVPRDARVVRQCFLMFKDALRDARREAKLATDSRLRERLEEARDRIRQRDMEISILLSKIQDFKDAMATMSKQQAGFCADELRLNMDGLSQPSTARSETPTPGAGSNRGDLGRTSMATRIYQKYSSEDRRAFTTFVSEQHCTRAKVRGLKAELALRCKALKELASNRGHEAKSPSLQGGTLVENVAEENAVKLREAKDEIVALREEIEGEKMRLVTTFEKWKFAAAVGREEVASPVENMETASQRSFGNLFEDDRSARERVSSEEALLSQSPVVRNQGDVHGTKPHRDQKHGVNYSNLIEIPTDGSVEKTAISSRLGSGRSVETVDEQDRTIGADALAKLRELRKGMEDIGRLENENSLARLRELRKGMEDIGRLETQNTGTQLISTGTAERDVDETASFLYDLEESVCSTSRGASSEIATERSDDTAACRDIISWLEEPESDKSNGSFCNKYPGAKNNAKPENTSIEIDDMVLTGDPEVDEEVINFYRARNKLFL